MYTALVLAGAIVLGAPAPKSKEPPLGKGPGYLGIMFSSGDEGGIEISEIRKGGPAEKAGLQPGDVLMKVNDTDLKDFDTSKFVSLIASMRPNQLLTFTVQRGTESMSVKVRLAERPADFDTLKSLPPPNDD